MRLYGYPEMDMHMLEYKRFVENVSKLKGDFDVNRLGLTLEVMFFPSDWLKSISRPRTSGSVHTSTPRN